MPDIPLAYLITFRCYGTSLHGDEQGSIDRHQNQYFHSFQSLGFKASRMQKPKVSIRSSLTKREPTTAERSPLRFGFKRQEICFGNASRCRRRTAGGKESRDGRS